MPKPVLFDERDVLKRLAAGDEDAFNQVYACYSPILYSEALRFLRSRELAQDFVQEIFTTVWDKRETFTEVEYLTTYLLTMGKNLAYQYWVKLSKEDLAKKEMIFLIKRQERVVENDLEGKELEHLLERTLALLPRQQKQVFHLAKGRGLSYKAISELLHISPHTVKNHLIAANQFIRKRLGYAALLTALCIAFVYHLLAA